MGGNLFNRSFPKTQCLHRGLKPPDRCGIQKKYICRILGTQTAVKASPCRRAAVARTTYYSGGHDAKGSIARIPPASPASHQHRFVSGAPCGRRAVPAKICTHAMGLAWETSIPAHYLIIPSPFLYLRQYFSHRGPTQTGLALPSIPPDAPIPLYTLTTLLIFNHPPAKIKLTGV